MTCQGGLRAMILTNCDKQEDSYQGLMLCAYKPSPQETVTGNINGNVWILSGKDTVVLYFVIEDPFQIIL